MRPTFLAASSKFWPPRCRLRHSKTQKEETIAKICGVSRFLFFVCRFFVFFKILNFPHFSSFWGTWPLPLGSRLPWAQQQGMRFREGSWAL